MFRTTTERADLDIADIFVEGVRQFGRLHADHYEDGLFQTFRLLADNPSIARLRPEFRPPVRLHAYRAHMVVYLEDTVGILIVRILHGRQDWERHLS